MTTVLGYPYQTVRLPPVPPMPIYPRDPASDIQLELLGAFIRYGQWPGRVLLRVEFRPNYGLCGLGLYAHWPTAIVAYVLP